MRAIYSLILCLTLAFPGYAQETQSNSASSAGGGGQTVEDIMARQRGETVAPRPAPDVLPDDNTAAGIAGQLGTLGSASDPDLWRALRYGSADVSVSSGGKVASVLIQDGGMKWYKFREGPLRTYGGWLLLGTMIALLVFFLIRGRIRIDSGPAGTTVTRFKAIERFGHWLLAGSFILLGLTGLITLFGRVFISPYLGKDVNSTMLIASKWIHNNVAWAFMLGLILVFVMWVVHNLPSRSDLVWIKQGGGIFSRAHPPAKKFNFGQKVVFWGVILMGVSVSASGLSMLFPFEIPMFAKTFGLLNATGLPQLFGFGALPVEMSPQEDMQLAQTWHAIVAFVMMAMIIAHIYIGTIGMEGAYSAMGNGEVDEEWARQHHSIWYDEVKTGAVPAAE